MSSGRPMNLRDLDTSSMERPARLDGGCQWEVGENGGQLGLTELDVEQASVVPCSGCTTEISEASLLPSQADTASVSFFVALGFGVLGGKMGQERLCLVFDSSIGLSLYISELKLADLMQN